MTAIILMDRKISLGQVTLTIKTCDSTDFKDIINESVLELSDNDGLQKTTTFVAEPITQNTPDQKPISPVSTVKRAQKSKAKPRVNMTKVVRDCFSNDIGLYNNEEIYNYFNRHNLKFSRNSLKTTISAERNRLNIAMANKNQMSAKLSIPPAHLSSNATSKKIA